MTTASKKSKTAPIQQTTCIDLPGEAVQCWRSGDNIQVVLRKHRDVVFDINLHPGRSYSVESKSDFYNPIQKKLTRRVDFLDGDPCHLWVGRQFKDELILKASGRILGSFRVNDLDASEYGADPKVKPEPLMIVMGQKNDQMSLICTPEDPFGVGDAQSKVISPFESKFSIMRELGTKFDYSYLQYSPVVKEYVAVTTASLSELNPKILARLEAEGSADGGVTEIFRPPKKADESVLYRALLAAAGYISGNGILTENGFKETAGYVVEHFEKLNQIAMKVHIEKKVKGMYRVALKGYLLSDVFGKITGRVKNIKVQHINVPLGSKGGTFIDGGFARTGKTGYGGFKRIIMTSAQNFRGGLKIQGIGTVIDLIVDANTVFFDEKGSRDLSEFLGRAGVSLAKAGATAALGSALAAFGTAILTAAVGVALPAAIVVGVVVLGFIAAAVLVDKVDEFFDVKNKVADLAR